MQQGKELGVRRIQNRRALRRGDITQKIEREFEKCLASIGKIIPRLSKNNIKDIAQRIPRKGA
jgi:hypothetical protein